MIILNKTIKMKSKFKKENPDKKKRKELSESLIKENPGKIPVIFEKEETSKHEDIKKTRYLLDENFTVGDFLKMVRKHMKLNEGEALYLSVKAKYNLTSEKVMGDIYQLYKDNDGFLYIMYSSQVIMG